MTDSPLRQQIAAALRPLLPEGLTPRVSAITAQEMADAVLAVINPIGKLLHAQLRHAECQLVATQAALRDVLAAFDGLRNSDGTGDIQHWQARATPGEYERWQAALRPAPSESNRDDGLPSEEAIARVRKIHRPAPDWSWKPLGCQHDGEHSAPCRGCRGECWPCPTIQALDEPTAPRAA